MSDNTPLQKKNFETVGFLQERSFGKKSSFPPGYALTLMIARVRFMVLDDPQHFSIISTAEGAS